MKCSFLVEPRTYKPQFLLIMNMFTAFSKRRLSKGYKKMTKLLKYNENKKNPMHLIISCLGP